MIAVTAHCSQKPPLNCPPKPTFNNLPKRTFDFAKLPIPQESKKSSDADVPKDSVLATIGTACAIFQTGQQIYSWFPSETDKKNLEERNAELARQQEIDKARRAFYKCCKDNNGLNVDRLPTGLATACQGVAMDYASLGYRQDVEEAVEFFNKFRE